MNFLKRIMKKRQITIVALAVIVCVAGYYNVKYAGGDIEKTVAVVNNSNLQENEPEKYGEATLVSAAPEDVSYFENAKISKEKSRSESIELIKSVLQDQTASAEAREKAQNEIFKISGVLQQETTIENLISAKGIGKSIVFINDGSINVVVEKEELSAVDAAKIQDIVVGETKAQADTVKIMEIKK